MTAALNKTFKLIVEYDGSRFHGWQRQKHDRTVQETIEKALSIMTKETVSLIGSGRTDAGVHALGQVASFKTRSHLDAETFFNGLNSLLPDDIAICACEPADDSFHARFDVTSKHYRYHILNLPGHRAIGRQFFWQIRKQLDIPAMNEAAAVLPGTNDFKAFEAAGSPRAHTIRTVTESKVRHDEDGMVIYDIRADGFLRFMVRNIVGTLVEVGLGKKSASDIKTILQSKDRSMASATAPAQGLFLMKVFY